MTAADDIHKYFFIVFSEKLRLNVSNESSARQRIHKKNQVLFSLKDKNKKLKCHLLQFLFGALRIKIQLPKELYTYIDKWTCPNQYNLSTSSKLEAIKRLSCNESEY